MKIHLLKYLPGDFNFLKKIMNMLIWNCQKVFVSLNC